MIKSHLNIIKYSYYRLFQIIISIVLIIILSSFVKPGNKKYGVTKVVIDAGHGGKDPGCKGYKSQEKDIALSIALRLGHYIEKNLPDVTVIYTRRDDHFVELYQRAEIANRNKADLFISIHCNANPSKTAYGVETYVMGLHKSEANLSVAKKENSAILLEDDYKKKYEGFDPNSAESYIIFSLYQNAYLDQSLSLASKVEKEFTGEGRTDRGVKQAGFLVLWKTYMPSMLVETGFLSNRTEEEFMDSEKGQNILAFSIYKAFKGYKNEVEGNVSKQQTDKIEQIEEKQKERPAIRDQKPETSEQHSADSSKSQAVKVVKQETEEGVIFMVQFYSSPRILAEDSKEFKGLRGIDNYFENNSYKYTIGKEKNLDEAKKVQKQVREAGFKDAFIIAFSEGKKVTIKEALEKMNKTK